MGFTGETSAKNISSTTGIDDLVKRASRSDTEALGEIYDRYSGRVYAFLLRSVDKEMAEELLQDIFVVLWQKCGMYNPALGSFEGWFFTLVRHRLYDALPSYQKRLSRAVSAQPGSVESPIDMLESKFDMEEHIIKLFRDEEIRNALKDLPPEQRQAILMTYFGGLSQREVAEELNLPVTTIKGRARMGLQRLRQLLPEQLL
ncbi:MAG: sigma-70 family RNA polymerase sigma factor [Chloroflexi bacterium]|uniref:Sigma-70 family RNA polymerase sigma factor n=1 Tax=Candidatus Chlorohelix allophototropha TaxID=3003348 RepID=A0A8T7M3M6_9CHLR|nr:sigma-70 family RNA polymerase sigma factor [Chloroflexota bacterium]WJW65765.1 sigma-70 family RNA polymerase sigma factor [Chloroflexota bacterium L227-S17]